MSDNAKEEKEKKRKKRIADMLFHLQVSRLNANVDIAAPSEEVKPLRTAKAVKNEDVGQKLITLREKLDYQRGKANDRWNRFAGTSDGGGMGR